MNLRHILFALFAAPVCVWAEPAYEGMWFTCFSGAPESVPYSLVEVYRDNSQYTAVLEWGVSYATSGTATLSDGSLVFRGCPTYKGEVTAQCDKNKPPVFFVLSEAQASEPINPAPPLELGHTIRTSQSQWKVLARQCESLYRQRTKASSSLSEVAYSGLEQTACDDACKEQYVRKFTKILSRNKPTMADYLALFSEPDGPEGMRLFYTTKKQPITGEDKDQEIILAEDALDAVMSRNKKSRSDYLTCVHKQYANRLPTERAAITIDGDDQATAIELSENKISWKFIFYGNESRPDSIITPDGIQLGVMGEDPCLLSRPLKPIELPR